MSDCRLTIRSGSPRPPLGRKGASGPAKTSRATARCPARRVRQARAALATTTTTRLGQPTRAGSVRSWTARRESGKPWAADIHVTPDGRFLYASERTTSTLAAFRVDPENGTLTPIDSYSTAQQPRAFGIDPSGRYLLAVGQLSNSMRSYSIDLSSGSLTMLKEYPIGRNTNWVEFVRLP
ncbi:hypothetical protein FEZ63_18040 [Microvirga brassicacearum]|uniref:Lactonase family protein n=1 Tax=Microvirga brassicacearum TaxID=2580413 RepID=A0A5N3P775_9HYPH|nr:hypothetical protein FEZ63_18040 [Microvirga brassicacearum]